MFILSLIIEIYIFLVYNFLYLNLFFGQTKNSFLIVNYRSFHRYEQFLARYYSIIIQNEIKTYERNLTGMNSISKKIHLLNRIRNFENGAKFWNEFVKNNNISNDDYVIVLASDNFEVNYYTLKYLAALKKYKKINRFFLLSAKEEHLDLAKKESTVPYTFYLVNQDTIDDFSLLFSVYRFFNNIAINDYKKTADADAFDLVGYTDISIQDIVAISILGLHYVPDVNEKFEFSENPIREKTRKNIDWDVPDNQIESFVEDYNNLEETMEIALDSIIREEKITKENKIVLFGATTSSRYIMENLKDYNYVAIVDNNPNKWGQIINGVKVYSPEEILTDYDEDYRIIVASQYYRDMCEQLYELGYHFNKQVFVAYHVLGLWDTSDLSIKYHESRFFKGELLVENIRKKYGDKPILLCPYAGTGDIYLIGLYFEKFCKQNAIKDYIFIVPSPSCGKIAELFGIKPVVIKGYETMYYLEYARVMGKEESGIYILNDCLNQIIVSRLRGYKNIDFNTMFQRLVFKAENKKINSDIKIKQESADEYFEKYRLKKGKTILISPYANTTSKIPEDVWKSIIAKLIDNGYDVVTNIGTDEEEPLDNTIGLFIPYKYLIDFVNKAGGFIGVRSGLCDIISSTAAVMCVLYPEESCFMNSSMYGYFSLQKMGLKQDNIMEIEFSSLNISQFIDDIVKYYRLIVKSN